MVKETGMVRVKCIWRWWETEIAEGRWGYRDKAMYEVKLNIVTPAPIHCIGALMPPCAYRRCRLCRPDSLPQ